MTDNNTTTKKRSRPYAASYKRAQLVASIPREVATLVLNIISLDETARLILNDYLVDHPEASQHVEGILWMAAYESAMEGYAVGNEPSFNKRYRKILRNGPPDNLIADARRVFANPGRYSCGYLFSCIRWVCRHILGTLYGRQSETETNW